jgi:hypothetical protein
MVELENPPENGCFGCGPANARGLRLRFERRVAEDGTSELRTFFRPGADETGWPGIFHAGLHFTVLYEVSYWTALELGGRLMVSTGPATYSHRRLPRVGRMHLARARLGPATAEGQSIDATTETEDGKPCGTLRSSWRPVERAEVERSGLALPPYLLGEIRSA